MKSELSSLSRLFTETIYRIPDYQRGYAWTDKQLRDFWGDIEQLEPDKNHYIGVLTVEDVPPEDSAKWTDDTWIIDSKRYVPFYVVDGQQRLTTAIILVQCIVEKLGEHDLLNYTSKDDIRKKFIFESRDGGISRSYLFGYEKDNPSYEYLKRLVLMERSDAHAAAETTIYTKNLCDAKEYFTLQIKDLTLSRLEVLYHKVTQKILFNTYVIASDIDVFVTFETMNNRGKRLSHLELLKNRLIWLSTKLPDPQQERDRLRSIINECWKSAYHFLGRSTEKALDDDVFLKWHYQLYFGAAKARASAKSQKAAPRSDDDDDERQDTESAMDFLDEVDYDDFLFDIHFIVKNIAANAPPQHQLTLHSLYEYAHSIKQLVEIADGVSNPTESTFPESEKVVLSQINRIADADDDVYLLLLVLYASSGDTMLRPLALSIIENIIFIGEVARFHIQIGKFRFVECAIDVMANVIDIPSLVHSLRAYIDERNKKTDLAKAFSYWASKPLGYYHWKPIRYFMFEYEQHLRAGSRSQREKLHWREFVGERNGRDYSTIEHILPQKVSNEYWKSRVKDLALRDRNTLKGSLGNLLPLSRSKNSSLGNRPFPEKKGNASNAVGYVYGCYSENEVSQEAEWTPIHILERGVRLLTFLETRWNVSLGNRDIKIKILGLDFLAAALKAKT